MFRKTIDVLLAVIILLFVTTQLALAWPDQPPARATISGPGIKGEIEITTPETLRALRLGGLEDFNAGIVDPPKNPGEGYKITRYFYDNFNFGLLTYYPNMPRSLVYFEDGPQLEGDHTRYNKQCFYATPDGDTAIRGWLADHAVSLNGLPTTVSTKDVENPSTNPGLAATSSINFTLPWLLVLEASLTIGIGLISGWLFWRRTHAR